MTAKFKALNAPPAAMEQGGVEVLSAAVTGGQQLSLQRALEEPDMWGILLADVARHVSRISAAADNISEEATIERIRVMFDAELDRPTDPGTTSAVS